MTYLESQFFHIRNSKLIQTLADDWSFSGFKPLVSIAQNLFRTKANELLRILLYY